MIRQLFFTFLMSFFFLNYPCFGDDQKKIDSLQNELKRSTSDEAKAKILLQLAINSEQTDNDRSMSWAKEALTLSEKINSLPLQAEILINIGDLICYSGKFSESIDYYQRSFNIYSTLKDSSNMAQCMNNLGLTYSDMGEYPEAVSTYLKGLKIAEKIRNKKILGKLYNNIGLVYYYQKDYSTALSQFRKSYTERVAINDLNGLATCYNNFGIVYEARNELDSALFNYYKALDISNQIKNNYRKAGYLDNIGNIYQKQNKLEEATRFNKQALSIREQINDRMGIAVSSINVASNYLSEKRYKEAEPLFLRALDISKEIGSKNLEKNCYQSLAEMYYLSGEPGKAYLNYKSYTEIKDSILNGETAKQISEMETRYGTEKKQREIEVLTAKNKVQELSANKQKIIIWAVTGVSALIIVFAFFMWNRFRITKMQKAIIETQKELVEEKQKEVLDSIHYAKRIQSSLLPTERYIDRNLKRLRKSQN